MSGALGARGDAAWTRVKHKVKNLGDLTALIRAAKPGGKVTSCNLTANVLGNILDPAWFFSSTMTPVHMTVQSKTTAKKSSGAFGGMTDGLKGMTNVGESNSLRQDQRVAKIEELLGRAQIVYITTSPDHHFVVFPINAREVVLLQGFEDVYNLVEWMGSAHKGGVFLKTSFIAAMNALVADNPGERRAAAIALFGFEEPGIGAQIADYFKIATEIVTIGHKSL